MYPFLLPEIFRYTVPMYDVMIMIGIFVMLAYVARRFEKNDGYTRKQTNLILILIIASLGVALLTSYVFDGIFHSIQEGELSFGSVTFIGGLIGGLAAFIVLMKIFYKDDNKDMKKILNTLITGVVIAHAFGRIGCFFAGCCYGIPTDSFLGVIFPHGHAHEAYPDIAVYPTQLFESAFLFILFILLNKVKSFKNIELQIYLIGYGVWRFLVEFIRGDDRGSLFGFIHTEYNVFPTPSQYLSLLMILLGVYLWLKRKKIPTKEIEE
ncbi:MAG: prolipoprotein diacylglyceryl transferase [Bacilli bacterium]|nr:prolipoprotein diacylglyceryl transferase [Bacilli bacterium]